MRAGRYVATASLDQQIAVWDVAGAAPAVVLKQSIAAVVLSLAWNPAANELAAGLTDGTLLVWPGVVPSHMVEPHVALPEAAAVPGAFHRCRRTSLRTRSCCRFRLRCPAAGLESLRCCRACRAAVGLLLFSRWSGVRTQ